MYKDFDSTKFRQDGDDKKYRSPSDRSGYGTTMHSSNQFGSPEHFIGTNFAGETLELEYKSSFLGAKLSELEETYKNQMNRQVLNSLTNLYKKIVEEMKSETDAKMAKQGEDHVTMTEKLRNDLKEEFNKALKKQRDEYIMLKDNFQNEMKLDVNGRLLKQREEYLQLKDNLYAQIKAEMNTRFTKQSEELLLTKESILGQLRSEMNAKFAKQSEEIALMRENIQTQLREEMDDKLAVQNDELILAKEDFQAQCQNLSSDLIKMQDKIELNLSKDIHALKAKVFEMVDSYSEKFQSIWTTVDSIMKHLGVKIDSHNGELSILRESVERFRHSSLSPERDSVRFSHTNLTSSQPQVEFLRDNLNRIADKLRVYREAIYAVTKNQTLNQSHWRIHQRELHLQGVSLEEACDQVISMDELAMIVKAVITEHKRESAKLKDVVDENAVAQNGFNASIANKVKDLEEVTSFAQENFNSLSEDFNLFVAQESHNTEVGINKRENLRRDVDKIAFRLEELSENYKHFTDPVALTRLQKMIWSVEKPEIKEPKQVIEPVSEDLGERMGAMEFVMWRYARHFVEPEAMKRIAKISRVTVPVYEKLENLLFLIKNSGFVEPRTVRHAIRVFKEAIARLGRRCIKEKQDAFEEVWKLIQASNEVDTVYYYYLMEVFSCLVSEEKTNTDRAYELSIFEYLFECLRKKLASSPAQACMLKTLWVLCKTEAHIEFIQRTHLVPDIVALCAPHLESYGKSSNPEPGMSPLTQLVEEKNQTLNFDSNDISEIDGMYVRTALVYYTLRLFSEIFKKASLTHQVDLTHVIQSILRLLKRTVLLHNIKELCLIVLHRIHISNPGKYTSILCIPECLELLEYNLEDHSLSKEAKTCTHELVISLRETGGPNLKPVPNFRTTVGSTSHHTRAKSVKFAKPMVTTSDFKISPTKLPPISQKAMAVLEKNFKAKLYERSDKLTEFLQRKLDLSTPRAPEGNIYNKTRKDRLRKNKFNDSDYTAVISKTGLMTCIPKNFERKTSTRNLKNVNSSSLYPIYGQSEESYDETIRRSRDPTPDRTVLRERMFHSFIDGGSPQDSEEEQSYMRPKSIETEVLKSTSAEPKEKIDETINNKEKKSEYTFREAETSNTENQVDHKEHEVAAEQH